MAARGAAAFVVAADVPPAAASHDQAAAGGAARAAKRTHGYEPKAAETFDGAENAGMAQAKRSHGAPLTDATNQAVLAAAQARGPQHQPQYHDADAMPDMFQPRRGAGLAVERLAPRAAVTEVVVIDDDEDDDVLQTMTRAAGTLLSPAVRMEHLDSGIGPSQDGFPAESVQARARNARHEHGEQPVRAAARAGDTARQQDPALLARMADEVARVEQEVGVAPQALVNQAARRVQQQPTARGAQQQARAPPAERLEQVVGVPVAPAAPARRHAQTAVPPHPAPDAWLNGQQQVPQQGDREAAGAAAAAAAVAAAGQIPPLLAAGIPPAAALLQPFVVPARPDDDEGMAIVPEHHVLPPNVRDIDAAQGTNIFRVPEQAERIMDYLRLHERRLLPRAGYMRLQHDINHQMRAILVDWLAEVQEEFRLHSQSLYAAVTYVDRFLSEMSVQRGKLQLLGVTCMMVAAKYEEVVPPPVDDFVYITDNTYTREQVLRMEHVVLRTLQFDLGNCTPLTFLERYLEAADANHTVQLLALYLCELTLLDGAHYCRYLPSVVALAAVCVALHTCGQPAWTPTLKHYSRHSAADINDCLIDVYITHRNAPFIEQQFIRDKYSRSRMQHVALIPPTPVPLEIED